MVIMRSWSNLEASSLWVLSQATLLALGRARSAYVVLCEQPSNPALQRSVNSRLRRLLPPAELWRSASSSAPLVANEVQEETLVRDHGRHEGISADCYPCSVNL